MNKKCKKRSTVPDPCHRPYITVTRDEIRASLGLPPLGGETIWFMCFSKDPFDFELFDIGYFGKSEK